MLSMPQVFEQSLFLLSAAKPVDQGKENVVLRVGEVLGMDFLVPRVQFF